MNTNNATPSNPSNRGTARPNALSATRKFAIRLALASGATISTLIGMQVLAFNEHPILTSIAPAVVVTEVASQAGAQVVAETATPPLAALVLPADPNNQPAPPKIVIIRDASVPANPPKAKVAPSKAKKTPKAQTGQPVAADVQPAQPAVVDIPQPVDAAPAQPAPAQPAPATKSSR